MTQDLLVDIGEEYYTETALGGVTLTVGLYNDGTDNLGDGSDLSAITSEPSNGNYARQSATFNLAKRNGNYGIELGGAISFDFTDVTPSDSASQYVETAFVVANFQADETGDSTATDHLIGNPALGQQRETGSVDSVDLGAGDLFITVD